LPKNANFVSLLLRGKERREREIKKGIEEEGEKGGGPHTIPTTDTVC
jgi:hypothetical protein